MRQHRPDRDQARTAWRYALAALICLAAGFATYHSTFAAHRDSESRAAAQRLEFIVLSLQALITRNEALPGLIGLEARLAALLESDQPAARAAANEYLERVAQNARISAAYLLNDQGLTLAASNWNQPVSFVDQNYGFRPYFREALAGRFGRFYGIGATSGEAGYFLASSVRTRSGARGVITVKLSLDRFEDAIKQSGDAVFIADREGVVVLSSVPEWKYSALRPLEATARERMREEKQYGDKTLPALAAQPLGLELREAVLTRGGVAAQYSLVTQPAGELGWNMVLLVDQAPSRLAAWVAAIAAACGAALVLGGAIHLQLTQRRRHEALLAKQALMEADNQLEQRIRTRTAEISAANEALERKVGELHRTEAILRETRDQAVQAGKLAVLGQMSAGMSHELSQPLTAMHTLSDNAIELLDNDLPADARENLGLIGELAGRMGRIVMQLKAFARADRTSLEAVDVDAAIGHALVIVESLRREVGAEIVVEPLAPGLCAQADVTRLEQVLVNLVRNALDEVRERPAKQVRIAAWRDGTAANENIRIAIEDTGRGIAPEVRQRLFEPFYTTKPAGEGLGLGLALSLSIVESFGGRIEAQDLARRGARFTVVLETSS